MSVEKPNIFLHETQNTLPYVSKKKRSATHFPTRSNPLAHAAFITRKLDECRNQNAAQCEAAAIRYKDGLYLEFSSALDHDLCTKSLENYQTGIRLLNTRTVHGVTKATVYIPAGKELYFLEKVQAYADSIGKLNENGTPKNPHNNDLVRSIEDIRLAVLDSFWVGNPNDMPSSTPAWCEVWLRFERNDVDTANNDFLDSCSAIGITANEKSITFPERIVRLVFATHSQLIGLISSCSYLAEIRRAPEPTSFFDKLSANEQNDWVNELLSRTTFLHSNATICLLDTGLNLGHPLIEPATNEQWIQSVEPSWGANDHYGHGTEMAGVALYNDLKAHLLDDSQISIAHQIESVKLLPPRGENPPELYGAVTQQAVSLAEIANPYADRSICIAVSSSNYNTGDGSPTSWSAAVDSIASGAEDSEKRLVLVSAGNVEPTEIGEVGYPEANRLHSVESPGQAWNALTVGAYTKCITIEDPAFSGFRPVADVGQLSPYSATSTLWSKKWPIKPEILLDGGNIATNESDYTSCPDLSLLTTNHQPLRRKFSTIEATSSATAQAAYMAAQIYAEYPHIWPETVRALLVHSARWTPQMKQQFCTEDTKSLGRKSLLRTCGYGIPDLQRAIQCANNSVNLIVEGELQPYEKENNQISMKEMHFHHFPWPSQILESLGNTEVELRVTLSYFVEPGPGEKGWKNRYRYPSCGLRFDVINSGESITDFQKRINVKMREDLDDRGDGSSGSGRWYLGSGNRDVGSIHSDFIIASAVELSHTDYLAIYPVVGWWRERSHLGKYNEHIRYSLIVSLSTPNAEVDLYTPIITQISNPIEIEVPTL